MHVSLLEILTLNGLICKAFLFYNFQNKTSEVKIRKIIINKKNRVKNKDLIEVKPLVDYK